MEFVELEKLIQGTEGENLEFKAARTHQGLDELTEYCVALRGLGLIERVSGDRYILPRLYYQFLDRESTYERLREKQVKKELLESFLSAYRVDGAPISELHSVLPDEDPRTIRRMLIELQDERRIHASGEKRWTRYFPGSSEG